MPIVTHEDEKLLARIDVDLAKKMAGLAKRIKKIVKQEDKMGDMYQDYTKDLREYIRKMRDKSKQMEVLAREDRSGIEDEEVQDYKQRIHAVDDQIKMLEGYYDRLKDLALHKTGMIKRMEEYARMVVDHSKIRNDIVDLGLKIEKEKNKMVAADSLSKTEDKLKDVEREFERSKKELEKKWAQLKDERKEVNSMWSALKSIIDEFEQPV